MKGRMFSADSREGMIDAQVHDMSMSICSDWGWGFPYVSCRLEQSVDLFATPSLSLSLVSDVASLDAKTRTPVVGVVENLL